MSLLLIRHRISLTPLPRYFVFISTSEDQRSRLFQPFVRADNSTTRKFGGTGLGLVLSQRLAEALDGSISLSEAKEGLGSTFTLNFLTSLRHKSQDTETNRATMQRPSGPSIAGTNVLVVDDSQDNRFLVTRLLKKHGCRVEVASDGEEAVNKALAGSYDVVLMDIQMPKMDGYQAKRELDKQGYEKPIVALTAHAMIEERSKTKLAGFTRHLAKPLDIDEVLETIAELSQLRD